MAEPDPNKVTQITSNADVEAIVSQYCESVEAFITDTKKVGLPPWPKQFYEYLFGLKKPIQTGSSSKDKYEHYYAVFTDPKGMYDAGYKLEDAQKFIREQQKQILDNIVANFKNIPGITQVDTSNICDKFPTDDCKLVKSSLRGNIILTFVYQMLFLDVIKSWNEKFKDIPPAINEKWKTAETSENGNNNQGFDITTRGFYCDPKGNNNNYPKAIDPSSILKANKKDFGNDIGQLSPCLANEVITKYANDDLASFALQYTRSQNSNIVRGASDGDIVSKNIEYNKNAHKAAIKAAKALLKTVFDSYTEQFLREIKNQLDHTESDRILNDFNTEYRCNISINQTQNPPTNQDDFIMDPDFETQFPGSYVVNDDVYYNWPDNNVSDKFTKLAGYLLAENEGYKPKYRIKEDKTLTDNDIGTNISDKVEPQLDSYDPHNTSFKLEDNKQNIKLKNATATFGNNGFEDSDKESNHIYYSAAAGADVAIVIDRFDYPDMSKQAANNAAACSYYPTGNLNKQNTAANTIYKYRTVFAPKYSGKNYDTNLSWKLFEELFPDTKGNWNFQEFVVSEFKKYFGLSINGKVTKTNIDSADFIGKRLAKLFTELKSRLHTIISKYSNATGEDLTKRTGSLDDIKFTHSIGDTFFNYVFKTFLTDTSGQGNEISSVEKPKDDFYFGTTIFNKGVEFPMDFAPGESVQKCIDQPDADKVNNKSILFRHIMPPIFTELDTILDNWSKDFNDVNHSYNADWMKNKTLLSDVLCTPVGLAYCHFIKHAPEDFWNKKINFDNLVDVLKNILAINIFYKLVLPLIDNKAVNRYLIYEILYNAIFNEEVDFVKGDTQDPEPKVTQSEGFEEDLRSPARLFGGSTRGKNGEILNNVIMIHDYNWCPVYNLGHERINPNDFSKLIIWEFQPNATVSTNMLFKAGADAISGAGGVIGTAFNKFINRGKETSKEGQAAGLDPKKSEIKGKGMSDDIKAFGAKTIGSGVVNYQIQSINSLGAGSTEKLNKVTDVAWVDKLLTGSWIGQYEIPFFNNSMMKSKSKDAWEMGNALKDTKSLLGAIKDAGQGNVQDIPIWSFDKTNQEGINWNTSFYLINDNVGNIKKNLAFISAFAAGTYWIQLNNFQYHCPNLYRVECPGRFFELYTSLDIAVNYYGKTQKLGLADTEYIFKDYIGLKAYDPMVIGSDIYIPEAYEIIIDSKSLQPNAFNIQYNYLLQGGESMRPSMNARHITAENQNTMRKLSQAGVDGTTEALNSSEELGKAGLNKIASIANNPVNNLNTNGAALNNEVTSVFSNTNNKQKTSANTIKTGVTTK